MEEEKIYLIIKDIERLFKSYFISYYNKFSEYYDINSDILYFNIEHLKQLINFLAEKIVFFLNKKNNK